MFDPQSNSVESLSSIEISIIVGSLNVDGNVEMKRIGSRQAVAEGNREDSRQGINPEKRRKE